MKRLDRTALDALARPDPGREPYPLPHGPRGPARAGIRRLRGAAPLVGGEPRGILGLGVGFLRDRRGDARRDRLGGRGEDAGRALVPRRAAQLRGEPAAPSRRRAGDILPRRGPGARHGEPRRALRPRVASRPGVRGGGRRGRRPGGGLPAERSRSHRRHARGRQHRRRLVVLLARFRRQRHARPVRPDRAQSCCSPTDGYTYNGKPIDSGSAACARRWSACPRSSR